MGVTIPSLSTQQVNDLLNGLQVNGFYPESFRIKKLITAGNFPTTDSAGGGSYVAFTWTPKVATGIVAITCHLSQIVSGATVYKISALVSYNSTITLGDNSNASLPDDEGNVIYRGSMTNDSLNSHVNFYPGNYYIEYNRPIYIFFWAETAALGAGNTFLGQVILHTIPTGLKV
jgi:hypothetical protein